jgi:hypothetical protein
MTASGYRRFMTRRFRRLLRKYGFPLAGWLSIMAYLVVAGGLPLPVPATATKDLSSPFPCMNSPCGCQNARQCWTSCCCHTPAERLAWARHQHVTPPLELVLLVDEGSISYAAATRPPSENTKACCAARHAGSSTIDAHHPHDAKSPTQRSTTDTVVGLRALQCHGIAHWMAAVTAVPPTVVGSGYQQAPTSLVSFPPLQFSSSTLPPPVPPPRLVIL